MHRYALPYSIAALAMAGLLAGCSSSPSNPAPPPPTTYGCAVNEAGYPPCETVPEGQVPAYPGYYPYPMGYPYGSAFIYPGAILVPPAPVTPPAPIPLPVTPPSPPKPPPRIPPPPGNPGGGKSHEQPVCRVLNGKRVCP